MKLDKYYHLYGRKDDVVFEEVPNPEPHWIPVTERLPEKGVYVLVTDSDGDVEVASVDEYWEDDTTEWKWFLDEYGFIDVTAWMPLPEPWKGEQDA